VAAKRNVELTAAIEATKTVEAGAIKIIKELCCLSGLGFLFFN
jgi:hypothetical protein